MRLIFFGTPEFAAVSLDALPASSHEVCAVVCRPDKPGGRGMKLTPPPVKVLAQRLGLPLFQPQALTDAALGTLKTFGADLFVVVAYGKLLPAAWLNPETSGARYGAANVHGSLLPRWRGPPPIQRAVMAGDAVSGVSLQQIAPALDAGDVLASRELTLDPGETYGSLYAKLSKLGAELLVQALDDFDALTPAKQDETRITLAPPILKPERTLDFSRPAPELERKVRGLTPSPGAVAEIDGARLKILKARAVCDAPGEIGVFYVPCGQGFLVIEELTAPSGKTMTGRAYLLGKRK